MSRHVRNISFVILAVAIMMAHTRGLSASGCDPWNAGILGATGTCETCWEGYLACEENCNYWAGQMGHWYVGYVEAFQCMEHEEYFQADISCRCYYDG